MLEKIQNKIGIFFDDSTLLKQALTHSSASKNNNQRLEFLGDAIIEYSISCRLYRLLPKASEHEMTVIRSSLVRKETLEKVANKLSLGEYLYLGESELKGGGRYKASILADAFEALIGAIFIDQGLKTVETLLESLFSEYFIELDSKKMDEIVNVKTILQEYLQSKKLSLPQYNLLSSLEDEIKVVECVVSDLHLSERASAKNRKEAEVLSAKKILNVLQNEEK